MTSYRSSTTLFAFGALLTVALTAWAGTNGSSSMVRHDMAGPVGAGHPHAAMQTDNRLEVNFPPAFKRQELANMRSHLESLAAITQYLSKGHYQAAANVAEQRLTRGAMSAHDRHQAARYMPKKMLAMGAAMHRAAGHFAIVAQNAAVTGDMAATLGAFAQVQQRCIACHSTYRMK